ncbi:MAG: arylesterase [Pseudomonadota bacterium]
MLTPRLVARPDRADCVVSYTGSCARFWRGINRAMLTVLVLLLAGVSPAAAERITLVAFGDSLVAGYGLPAEEGFVPQLQVWLDARGHEVEVINAGVSGDTTTAGLARLDWTTPAEADAVLLELGANDALRGIDPSIARENLDQMIARFKEKGLAVMLAGMYAPRNWGPEYVTEFEAIYPDLAEKHDVQLYPFFLEGVAADQGMNQPDGIHPNKDGVAVLVETIGPEIEKFLARLTPQPTQ